MAFVPLTSEERDAMLADVGVASVAELFSDIPERVRFPHLDVPPPLTELDTVRKMSGLAQQNRHLGDLACFVGAGAYDHFIPSVVGHMMGRSEFYTAYTPYQPEMSQGTLQYMFEFQSLVCDLFEMDVSNSAVYDGASGVAESVLMALRITGRDGVVMSGTVHPDYRAVVSSYLDGRGVETCASEVELRGATLVEQPLADLIDQNTACCVVQQPDFFGSIRDFSAVVSRCREVGALLVYVIAEPVSLGVLKTPGAWDADIAAAEGQPLGVPLSFGGPWVGLMACKQQHLRQMPGRIVGQTTDHDGRRGFVLTLQAREQHIRREKATSNICTSQTLLALGVTVYLAALGPVGLRQVASLSHKNARSLADRVRSIPGYQVVDQGPYFNELVVLCPDDAAATRRALLDHGIVGGLPLGRDFPGFENALLLCCTEKTTPQQIDQLAGALCTVGGARV